MPSPRKLGLWPLVAATYFMVAGGPYGLEDIVGSAGYAGAIVILIVTPLIWSVPTALMVSELSSALPEEGGFYAWVRRGMGRFWGFQEAWLSMMGSLFDMALYPALFVGYVGHLAPALAEGHWPIALGLGMIVVCTVWNLFGTRAVGVGALWLSVLLLSPFVVLVGLALFHGGGPVHLGAVRRPDLLAGILVAMWNYMGWDNASTVAGEVDQPQRTYPRAMFAAVTLVTVSYLVPVIATAASGISAEGWTAGGWVGIGRELGGTGLAAAIALAGIVGAVGTFNALTMSLSRLPLVMAQEGLLPRVFARVLPRTGAPWVAIVVCSLFWALCFPLGFVRLVILDVFLTGLSILLEFVALVVLRVREPGLHRPYRVPGGLFGAIAIGIGPVFLMGLSVIKNHDEQIGGFSALAIGVFLALLGPLMYFVMEKLTGRARRAS